MSNIGIDASFLRPGIVGGAEFMMKNLVSGMEAACAETDRLTIFCVDPWGGEGGKIEWIRSRQQNRFVQGWKAAVSHAKRLDALLFPNYFTPPLLSGARPRIVTVIHDLQYLHFPEYVSKKKRLWLRAAHELTLWRADAVVVISNFVKDDLLKRYGRRWETKVKVIPNPVSWERFDLLQESNLWIDLAKRFDYPNSRFILSVAAQYPHKNLETLIHAFRLLKKDNRFNEVKLVLAGQLNAELVGTTRIKDLNLLIRELGVEKEIFITGFVSDVDLGHLYQHAELFVFPSLFEGFGMPAVEALGFGLPVLTTSLTSIPDVTKGHAVYLEKPRDPTEMANWLASMLDDPIYYRPQPDVISSLKDTYSPKRIGAEYYRELLNSS